MAIDKTLAAAFIKLNYWGFLMKTCHFVKFDGFFVSP